MNESLLFYINHDSTKQIPTLLTEFIVYYTNHIVLLVLFSVAIFRIM